MRLNIIIIVVVVDKKAVFFMVSCSILEERKTKTKNQTKLSSKSYVVGPLKREDHCHIETICTTN